MGTVKIIHGNDLHLVSSRPERTKGPRDVLGQSFKTMKLLKSLPVGSPDKIENSLTDQDGRVSLEQ